MASIKSFVKNLTGFLITNLAQSWLMLLLLCLIAHSTFVVKLAVCFGGAEIRSSLI